MFISEIILIINNSFIFRFHDDNQFWRYTGEVRNPFGQDLYKVQLTCRSIFTDPNNHQELHDNHVKTFNNYYGYWFKEDLFAYDARYQVKEAISALNEPLQSFHNHGEGPY